mmetsp:Transcript_28225/g.52056  ORF Transcript_28225/g.52056 Transcript_28225/m.52056 type:complete len:103 (+) Transcript_28225:1049-1357(+)
MYTLNVGEVKVLVGAASSGSSGVGVADCDFDGAASLAEETSKQPILLPEEEGVVNAIVDGTAMRRRTHVIKDFPSRVMMFYTVPLFGQCNNMQSHAAVRGRI